VIPARPDSTVHNAPPVYPEAAARRGESGTVVLVVHIAPDGHASGVDVADSSGHDALDRAAREAVAKWRFRPAQDNGLAVASSMVIDIHFNLTGKAR
jgi:protein TonB